MKTLCFIQFSIASNIDQIKSNQEGISGGSHCRSFLFFYFFLAKFNFTLFNFPEIVYVKGFTKFH